MVLRGKTQKYVDTEQEDNLNELRLKISHVRYVDTNLVIMCDNLQSPVISGLMLPSRDCCSNVKLLPHSANLNIRVVAELLSVTSL